MESELLFDDALFDDVKERVREIPKSSYAAKNCHPNWFSDDSSFDPEKKQQVLKYRADWAFHKKKYQDACENYTETLALVAPGNAAMRRDVQSALVLCHLGLKQTSEALKLACVLLEEAQNFEHKTSSLYLIAKVQECACMWPELASTTERLLILHPQSAGLWQQLARAYAALSKPTAVDICEDLTSASCAEDVLTCAEDEEKLSNGELSKDQQPCYNDIAVKSLIRARLLLQMSSYHLPKYMRERHKDTENQISVQLECLNVSQDAQDGYAKCLRDSLEKLNPDEDDIGKQRLSPERMLQESDAAVHQYVMENLMK